MTDDPLSRTLFQQTPDGVRLLEPIVSMVTFQNDLYVATSTGVFVMNVEFNYSTNTVERHFVRIRFENEEPTDAPQS